MSYDDCEGYPIPAVCGIVYDPVDETVLLGIRQGSHSVGCYQFPGGKIDLGETAAEAVVREGQEEHGLTLPDPVWLPYYSDDLYPEVGEHYLCMYFVQKWNYEEPRVMEPRKCSLWDWFSWSDLPRNLMGPGGHELNKRFPDLSQVLRDAGQIR